MNSTTLRLTRALLGAAIAVTGFITRNAAAITKGAEALHAIALDLTLRLADSKVQRAWNAYDRDLQTIELLRKQTETSYSRFKDMDKYLGALVKGVTAEKQNLGIA